jgi:hypothetical protein
VHQSGGDEAHQPRVAGTRVIMAAAVFRSRVGLAERPEDWLWSSVHDYVGAVQQAPVTPSGLSVDRVLLPADERTRI